MFVSRFKRLVFPYHRNLGGWRSNRKIVVIESDDWGSIRMPSRSVYERCLREGYPVEKSWYERYDSLLSEDDLELLFELLTSVKDANDRNPVITANVIVGNPDFDAIESTGRREYRFEPITETFKRYPRHARCLQLWNEGRQRGVFFPQFHGREHFNVALFMNDLRRGDPVATFAFANRMAGCIPKSAKVQENLYVRATQFRSAEEKENVRLAQIEGLRLFSEIFGESSRTMIPTNYTWSSDFDSCVAELGVEAFQGSVVMKEQQVDGSYIPIRRRIGDQNEIGQTYLVRNAAFEPSQSPEPRMNAVDHCLYQIRGAFQLSKPAVISTHRLNFCGFIDETNRDQNLEALKVLLEKVLKKWPDVEFMTSVDLLDLVRDRQLH